MSQKCKVLVLDDDLAMRPLWESILQRTNVAYELIWAVSSEQALNIVSLLKKEGHMLSLIIADIFLAGSMTGIDFLSRKEIRDIKTAKIITSSVDQNCLESLCQDEMPEVYVMNKPLDLKMAGQLVTNLLYQQMGAS